MSSPELTLYTAQTPNGVKISILLEELGLPYKVKALSFSDDEQKEPWFLAINPNGRIPALTDHKSPIANGQEYHLFESGSIMLYLTEHYDPEHKLSFQRGTTEYADMISWLFWQNAGLGPMQGQSNHFVRYAPEKIEYGMNRYKNETRRLYSVMEKRLKEQEGKGGYMVGDHISIVDIACYGWVDAAGWAGVEVDEKFPTLKAWLDKLAKRSAVKKGEEVPNKSKLKEIMKDKDKMDEYAKQSSAWVQKGMKDDASK